jgi:4-hydroxyphenylacetate decarboxylase small subunit
MNRLDNIKIMKHYDCKYYLSTDVFKGICKRDKNNILADEPSCTNFEKAQKCKHCSNFTLIENDLGTCMGKYDAYPEMNAVTCNDFKQ